LFVVTCFIGVLTVVQFRLRSRKIIVSQTTSIVNKHKQRNSSIYIPERYAELSTNSQANGKIRVPAGSLVACLYFTALDNRGG